MYRRITPTPTNPPLNPLKSLQSTLYYSLNPTFLFLYPNISYIVNSEIGHKPEIGIKSEMAHGKKTPIGALLV